MQPLQPRGQGVRGIRVFIFPFISAAPGQATRGLAGLNGLHLVLDVRVDAVRCASRAQREQGMRLEVYMAAACMRVGIHIGQCHVLVLISHQLTKFFTAAISYDAELAATPRAHMRNHLEAAPVMLQLGAGLMPRCLFEMACRLRTANLLWSRMRVCFLRLQANPVRQTAQTNKKPKP